MTDCGYGRIFEPDAPEGIAFSGQSDAVRPLVKAPTFPAPSRAREGESLRLRLIFIGPAANDASGCLETLREAGRERSLGPDRIGFELDGLNLSTSEMELPTDGGDIVAALRVRLTTPLLLRSAQGGKKTQLIRRPTFADLFSGCLRTVGRLQAIYAGRLPDEVFHRLKDMAAQVRTLRHEYHPFRQFHWSNRGQAGGRVEAITGYADFADVPSGLAAWLTWAGKLHVGTYRVSGAGGWQVETPN